MHITLVYNGTAPAEFIARLPGPPDQPSDDWILKTILFRNNASNRVIHRKSILGTGFHSKDFLRKPYNPPNLNIFQENCKWYVSVRRRPPPAARSRVEAPLVPAVPVFVLIPHSLPEVLHLLDELGGRLGSSLVYHVRSYGYQEFGPD